MHFAAFANVGEAVADPESYYRNNVGGTLRLLLAMRRAGIDALVFSSTCAVYGIPARVPINEATPVAPVNPYGETKLAIEKALHWYGQAYGLRSVSLRYFNAAGASPDGDAGEDHDPETHLIPLAIRAALNEARPIEIYGADYPTPDGTAIRDYVHVSDLADAHVRALAYLAAGDASATVNLGTGHGYSVRQVIEAVERVSRLTVARREAPRRAGDPPALVADPTLAESLLGWRTRYSDLDTIVRTALAWQCQTKTHPLAATAAQQFPTKIYIGANMSKNDLPPVPPAGRTDKGPGAPGAGGSPSDLASDAAEPRHRNIEKQGRQGNIKVNTTNQGYQQDR